LSEETIKCPHCDKEIRLTEALFHQVEERARKGLQKEAEEREKELTARENDIKDREKGLQAALEERLKKERAEIKASAGKEARADLEIELKDLKERDKEKTKRLEEAERAELELRKRSRRLDKEKDELELNVARKMAAERDKLKKETLEIFSEEHRLKDLENTKQMNDLKKTIEELRRKSEQGSMQTQGEVGELDIEELLRRRFPTDDVAPVPKGIKGADILQKVFTRDGSLCGTLIWEIKNTKAWQDGWIDKLKEDQREVGAELAVLVSKALPQGVDSFKDVSGVWVSDFQTAESLAEVLRYTLIELARSKASLVGKGEKMDLLYNYMSGQGFRQRIEGIVEAFSQMKIDLDSEKRAMTKIWSKREKQIERAITNSASMYGDMQGIIGASLPEIKTLELGGPTDEVDDEE
jgi:hypothetical protein